jgi:hypothetical protein
MSYTSPFTGQVIQPTDVSYSEITLSADTQLEWPINGNATDNVAARIMQVQAITSGLSMWMPPADQTSVGNDALIRNVGSSTFNVKDFGGEAIIVSVAPGESKYIYITSNPDVHGTWGIIAFGVGSSAADAATLAGMGLTAISSTLNQSHPVASLTSGYTFLAGDRAETNIWTGGATNVYLPQASTLGDNWFTLIKNNGSGTMTVNTTGGELLDGATTKSFAPGESAFIVCSGTAYVTIGYGQSTLFNFTVLTKPVTGGAYSLSANEAANNIQIYTGTLTSNVTVTYPPVANLYVISNQCSAGGFTLTVTTGISGGATATVPAAGQATLFCDGTNFYNANTTQVGATSLSVVNGTAGAPSINFASETSTGIYRPGSGRWGVSILGNEVLDVDSLGIAVTGTGSFSGGISGGTF